MRESTAPAQDVVGVFHAGVTVSDMDRALGFYRDMLGLVVERDWLADGQYLRDLHGTTHTAIHIVFLRVPGSDVQVELLEYQGVERMPAAARPFDHGVGHLCLYVRDLTGLLARLREAGTPSRAARPIEVTSGPNHGARLAYVSDPDGFWVELFERPVVAPRLGERIAASELEMDGP